MRNCGSANARAPDSFAGKAVAKDQRCSGLAGGFTRAAGGGAAGASQLIVFLFVFLGRLSFSREDEASGIPAEGALVR